MELSKATGELARTELESYRTKQAELEQKLDLAFLFDRVTTRAQPLLKSDNDLRQKFLSGSDWPTFVLSIDIRRSTELMLKARTPELFAGFMTHLCNTLQEIVKDHYGVFDKFTGDGVLAFFPEFFSGNDAGYNAIATAREAQTAFSIIYHASRTSFKTILNDVGLGIGIDYGQVHIIPIAGGLTAVGEPVVYACRLGDAPAGKIYLNQPAYEQVHPKYSQFCTFAEQPLDVKHEGSVLCYELRMTDHSFTPEDPDWVSKEVPAETQQ